MFDTTIVKTAGTQINKHYVEEKRAPTDESVRLLREMEQSARQEVIKSIRLPSNDFGGVVHLMKETLSASTKVAVLFELNGKKHKVNITLDEFVEDTMDKKIVKIVSCVSDYLSSTILQEVFKSSNLNELRNF